MELLKYGLSHSVPPKQLRKPEVFTAFDLIHRFLRSELSSNQYGNTRKTDISYVANNYYSNYRPSLNTLKKHKILEKLRRNKDIVTIRPDKGNGVVVMDRIIYNQQMYEIRTNLKNCLKIRQSYAKDSYRDIRENLKRNSEHIYPLVSIYLSGSQPSRFYCTPKFHKIKCDSKVTLFRPIVSSIV